MDSHDFCLWLNERLADGAHALSAEDTADIRRRLSDVFVHDIDPSLGDEAHLARLRATHEGGELQ